MAGRILIVEDNADNRELLVDFLELEGHGVDGAEDGLAGLEKLRATPFDLVVLDLMMPRMNGWSLREAMLADASLAQIPVIVVSAAEEVPPPVRIAAFLPKPLDLEAIAQLARQLTDGQDPCVLLAQVLEQLRTLDETVALLVAACAAPDVSVVRHLKHMRSELEALRDCLTDATARSA